MQVGSASTLDFQMARDAKILGLMKQTAEQQGAQALQLIEASGDAGSSKLAASPEHLGNHLDIRV